jgi:hypothetical protein
LLTAPIATVLAVSHPWELTDEQFAAIRALQGGAATPRANEAIWRALQSLSMVWIDESGDPHVVRLTPGATTTPANAEVVS